MESILLIEKFNFDLSSLNAKALEERGTLWKEIQGFLLGYFPQNEPALSFNPWNVQVVKGQLESLKYIDNIAFSINELRRYNHYQDVLNMDFFILGYFNDQGFKNYFDQVQAKLKARVANFTVNYSTEEWNIDIEEYFTNSLLNLNSNIINVEIHDSFIRFSTGVKVQTYTPSELQEKLLNIICEDHYDDSDFGSIIEIIKPISEEHMQYVIDIAYNTSFPASIFSHAKSLKELADLRTDELRIVANAIVILNDEWCGSVEDLIQVAKALVLQK